MEYIIATQTNKILSTNIEDIEKRNNLLGCEKDVETVMCPISNRYIRNGFIDDGDYRLFLSCDNENITNKIFKHYLTCFKSLSKEVIASIENSKVKEHQNTRRLKHNLINHNTNILQELYKLFPQDKFKGETNHLEIIESAVSEDTKKTAFTFLKVLKNSNLMKAEFDVYEMLGKENPDLDFFEHSIHKVVLLTLNPFWLDLIQNGVHISIQNFYQKIRIDYNTISVALAHIFDNATKYLAKGSDYKISFEDSNEEIKIIFDMISLKIYPDEADAIFLENISGKLSKEKGLAGDGIGMFMISKLIKLNNGDITLKINFDKTKARLINKIPYENNLIEIRLRKN